MRVARGIADGGIAEVDVDGVRYRIKVDRVVVAGQDRVPRARNGYRGAIAHRHVVAGPVDCHSDVVLGREVVVPAVDLHASAVPGGVRVGVPLHVQRVVGIGRGVVARTVHVGGQEVAEVRTVA